MANHSGGYQIPLELHPTGRRCVTFELPDDLFYIANFWGAIGELAKWTSYQRTGDDSGLQAAIVMSEVIDAARETFLTGCEGDAPLTPEIVEVVKYILMDSSNESEDCENGDMEMCNCGKCGSAVYFDLESKKKYVMDAQCQRVYIEENEVTPELAGVDDWENAGKPPLPADLPVPHDNALYQNNTEAQQCAKATAIVNEMWNLMSVYTALEGGQTFAATISALTSWAAVQFPATLPANVAAAWASFLTTLISVLGLQEIINEMEPIYEDTAAKDDIICAIVSKMVPPEQVDFSWFGGTVNLPIKANTIYASDIKAAVDAFKAAFPDADITTKWINLFPLASWREIVTQKIPETLCGCDAYVPVDPMSGMGVITGQLVAAVHRGNAPQDFGTPANYKTTTPQGVKLSETSYETELQEGGMRTLGMLFYVPVGVRFTNFRFHVQYVGAAGGSQAFESSHYVNDGETLEGWEEYLEPTGTLDADLIIAGDNVLDSPGISPARYYALNALLYNGVSADKLVYSNIRFDIAAADGSWTRTNIAPGVPFQM